MDSLVGKNPSLSHDPVKIRERPDLAGATDESRQGLRNSSADSWRGSGFATDIGEDRSATIPTCPPRRTSSEESCEIGPKPIMDRSTPIPQANPGVQDLRP